VEPLTLTSEINADDALMRRLVFIGINGHALGQSNMMTIISVDDIGYGRLSHDDSIIRVKMEMGDLKTVLSIELSKEQLQEILKIGLRSQFGPNVDSVRVVSMYHSLKKYDLEVTFVGRG
jgi:predicted transcriptional regulator